MAADPKDALALLEQLAAEPGGLADLDEETRNRLRIAAGRLAHPDGLVRRDLRRPLFRLTLR
jgi:hypothetical protein